jgi:hypothetical protein
MHHHLWHATAGIWRYLETLQLQVAVFVASRRRVGELCVFASPPPPTLLLSNDSVISDSAVLPTPDQETLRPVEN